MAEPGRLGACRCPTPLRFAFPSSAFLPPRAHGLNVVRRCGSGGGRSDQATELLGAFPSHGGHLVLGESFHSADLPALSHSLPLSRVSMIWIIPFQAWAESSGSPMEGGRERILNLHNAARIWGWGGSGDDCKS